VEGKREGGKEVRGWRLREREEGREKAACGVLKGEREREGGGEEGCREGVRKGESASLYVECVLYRMCSLWRNVFSIAECDLYRM